MGKAKMIGYAKPIKNHPDYIWKRKKSLSVVKKHDPYFSTMFGGADSGCLLDAVSAGIKHKRKRG